MDKLCTFYYSAFLKHHTWALKPLLKSAVELMLLCYIHAESK